MSPRPKKTGQPRRARGKGARGAKAAAPVAAETEPAAASPEPAPAVSEPASAPLEPAPPPLEPAPAHVPILVGLPDEVRSVVAHGKISQVALSDDGELIAIASMSADRRAPTLAVHRTADASEICSFTVETIAGNGKAACFDAHGDLLFMAGDTLHRLKIGSAPERLGRIDCESMFRDAAGKRLALVERSGAVRFVPADAPLSEGWRHDAGRGHMTFGTQVRFIGDTGRALIGGLADHGPLLVDVAEQKVLREYPHRGACADASPSGDLILVYEPRGRRDDWFSVFRADAEEPMPIATQAIGSADPIAFAPDGHQLVKTAAGVTMIDVATGAASETRATDALTGSTHTPALLARGAPVIGWSSFNFKVGDFRAYWARFSSGKSVPAAA
jgi:hypothetical protein